jgi:plastocyanin
MALTLPALACGEDLGPNGEKLVNVQDNAFDPSTKTIAVGDAVLWQWQGSNQHNVTWVVTSGGGNSATQTTGTFTRNFTTAGSYDYYCTIHGTATSGMHGTIVVQ